MTTRRTFVLNAISLAGMSIFPKTILDSGQSPLNTLTTLDDDDFDISGFYIAVARESDGSLNLSEIIDNRLKERETFLERDMEGILNFIDRIGLRRIRFFDWHATSTTDDHISVHEIEIDWIDGNLPPNLASFFRECTDLLSCPQLPQPT